MNWSVKRARPLFPAGCTSRLFCVLGIPKPSGAGAREAAPGSGKLCWTRPRTDDRREAGAKRNCRDIWSGRQPVGHRRQVCGGRRRCHGRHRSAAGCQASPMPDTDAQRHDGSVHTAVGQPAHGHAAVGHAAKGRGHGRHHHQVARVDLPLVVVVLGRATDVALPLVPSILLILLLLPARVIRTDPTPRPTHRRRPSHCCSR